MDRTPRWVIWWGYSGTTTLDILAMPRRLGYLDEAVKINLYYVPGISHVPGISRNILFEGPKTEEIWQ